MKKNAYTLFFLLILFSAFAVRLYRFNGPIADWHSWRQADTSAVSRNFVTRGFDILHPQFDDLSNVPSGIDNPHGYRFVEFPIYNVLQAGLFKSIGILSLEEWGRLITIFSSLGTTVFLYLIVSKHLNKTAGILAAFFFALTPYNIYYGRTILPDPSMAMASLGGVYFFDLAIKKELRITNYELLISMIFTIIALLLKPYAAIFTLPMLYLVWEKFGFSFLKKWQLWIFAIISVLPLLLWRFWIQQFPEGVPANAWLLNGNGIRFRPAFFRWMVYERLTKLISGYAGVVLIAYGLWHTVGKRYWFFLSFVLASILYVCIFATGNVQHDYYQILIMPSVAMLCGVGAYFLFAKKLVGRAVLIIATIGMLYFGWKYVKDYFNINNPSLMVAGAAVDKIATKNAKVIAPYNGDTSLLYQTKRQGWPSLEKPVPELIKMGASYLVLQNPTKADLYFAKYYKIIAQTREYLLYDLHQKP